MPMVVDPATVYKAGEKGYKLIKGIIDTAKEVKQANKDYYKPLLEDMLRAGYTVKGVVPKGFDIPKNFLSGQQGSKDSPDGMYIWIDENYTPVISDVAPYSYNKKYFDKKMLANRPQSAMPDKVAQANAQFGVNYNPQVANAIPNFQPLPNRVYSTGDMNIQAYDQQGNPINLQGQPVSQGQQAGSDPIRTIQQQGQPVTQGQRVSSTGGMNVQAYDQQGNPIDLQGQPVSQGQQAGGDPIRTIQQQGQSNYNINDSKFYEQNLQDLWNRLRSPQNSFDAMADLTRLNYQRFTEPALKESFFPGSGAYKNALAIGREEMERQLAAQQSMYEGNQWERDWRLFNFLGQHPTDTIPQQFMGELNNIAQPNTNINQPFTGEAYGARRQAIDTNKNKSYEQLASLFTDLVTSGMEAYAGSDLRSKKDKIMGGSSTAEQKKWEPTQAQQWVGSTGKKLANTVLPPITNFLLNKMR